MGSASLSSKGHRYPVEVTSPRVWPYLRLPLWFREVGEVMLERGIVVSRETVRHWCDTFAQRYAGALRRRQLCPGDTHPGRRRRDGAHPDAGRGHPNCAVLVIAHRLAIVRHADRIVVPEDGRPVASGRHDELFVTSPMYRELAATHVLPPQSDGS